MLLSIPGLLPPHVPPEFDALNYHYTLPRQHLITGSFAHLKWSVADLWLLPFQFSLAPYWFSTVLPNKVPQFIFMLGLWAVVFRLAQRFSPTNGIAAGVLALLAVIGSHGFSIPIWNSHARYPYLLSVLGRARQFVGRKFHSRGHEKLVILGLVESVYASSNSASRYRGFGCADGLS